jgi:hypothetical protein
VAEVILNRYQLECLVRLQGNSDYEEDEIAVEWKEDGPEGPGLYAWYPEYPEEGIDLLPEVSPNVIALEGKVANERIKGSGAEENG